MTAPASYIGVLKRFQQLPEPIRNYFWSFEKLVRDPELSWEVSLAHIFAKVETAKHMTICCAIVKLHWTDAALTWELVEADHMSRGRFRDLLHMVLGKPLDKSLVEKLQKAEKVRDKVLHGKDWTEAQVRQALVDIFDFSENFNKFVFEVAGFRPFSDLRGFKGRAHSLPKSTTRWVLRGMGIGIKAVNDGI